MNSTDRLLTALLASQRAEREAIRARRDRIIAGMEAMLRDERRAEYRARAHGARRRIRAGNWAERFRRPRR